MASGIRHGEYRVREGVFTHRLHAHGRLVADILHGTQEGIQGRRRGPVNLLFDPICPVVQHVGTTNVRARVQAYTNIRNP